MSTTIREAVILAAGRGSRLEGVSGGTPKSLVPVAGRPLLLRMLDTLRAAGTERVVMAVGYRAEVFRDTLGDVRDGMEIVYAHNADWESTNNIVSLLLAAPFVTGDLYMIEADVYCAPDQFALLSAPDTAAVAPFEPYMDGTVVATDTGGNISRFILKDDPTRPEDCRGLLKTVNLYSLRHATLTETVVPAMETLIAAGGSGVFYEKALAAAVADGSLALGTALFDNGAWGELDDSRDMRRAEAYFARASRSGRPGPEGGATRKTP